MRRATSLVLLYVLLFCCGSRLWPDSGEYPELPLVAAYRLDIPEPSGLAMAADGRHLWTVSDSTGSLYLITPEGETAGELRLGRTDLEGIAAVGADRLAVVCEKSGEILLLDTRGQVLASARPEVGKEIRLRPEGIAFNGRTRRYYVINEKRPPLLLELDENLVLLRTQKLDFADDLSGSCWPSWTRGSTCWRATASACSRRRESYRITGTAGSAWFPTWTASWPYTAIPPTEPQRLGSRLSPGRRSDPRRPDAGPPPPGAPAGRGARR